MIKKLFSSALCAALLVCFIAAGLNFSSFAAGLPQKYESGSKTPVLNQKNNPLCWAYSCSDLLGINAVKNGYAKNGSSVFSAPMIARAEFDGNEHRYTKGSWYKSYGGIDYALMAGTVGKGLADASKYAAVTDADSAPVSALYPNMAYIDTVLSLETNDLARKERTEKIKEWIYEYGAVSADLFVGEYNSVTGVAKIKPYDNSKSAHAILLVGWDDTKYTDTGTGAFLMKNSWGESWGKGGYAWISYNSEFGRTMYAANVTVNSDARVLSHTEICHLSGSSYSAKDGKAGAVNVFDVKEKMTVKYAGIFTNKPKSEIEVSVWVNLSDAAAVTSKTPDAKAKASVSDRGFFTLTLDRQLDVRPGDTVTALYLVKSDGVYYVYSEYSDPDYEMAVTSSKAGQSYTLSGGTLKNPRGNYLGTLVGFTEHKDPPVTEPPETKPPVTEPPATNPPVTEPPATNPPVTEPPETDTETDEETEGADITFANGTETEEDTAVIVPVTEYTEPGTESDGGSSSIDLTGAVKNVFKTVLIVVGIVILLFVILIIALVAASKKKKV